MGPIAVGELAPEVPGVRFDDGPVGTDGLERLGVELPSAL